MMAAGLKPCCLIWSGVSEDGDNPQFNADFAKVCLWMTTVNVAPYPISVEKLIDTRLGLDAHIECAEESPTY